MDKIRKLEDFLVVVVNCMLDFFRGRDRSSARGSLREFSIFCPPCGRADEAWRSTTLNLAQLFFSFHHILFFETLKGLKVNRKKSRSLDLSYYGDFLNKIDFWSMVN